MLPRCATAEGATVLQKLTAMLIALFTVAALAAPAHAARRAHHHRHHSGVNHALVATINAKLRRWVRPTGSCPMGTREVLATYYGSESGTRTATGERFRPLGHTAAHRTLAFGTQVHVTNPHTGRSVTVRINDRGPATHAEFDLSVGSARAIGMHSSSYVCVSS